MADGVGEIYHVPKKIGAKIQKLNLKTYKPIIQSISSNSNDRKRCLLSPKNENLDDEIVRVDGSSFLSVCVFL